MKIRVLSMKLTKGTIWPQSGEGTTHEVRSLPTKVRGPDKGTDNAPGLQDIYSLEERVGTTAGFLTTLAPRPAKPCQLLACGPQASKNRVSERSAAEALACKPGLAWKRKAPLVMSWNLIHPSSYQASGLGPRCARPRPRLCQLIWISDFART